MIFNFEEIPVTINGITYLADGAVEYDWNHEYDEPWLEHLFVDKVYNLNGELEFLQDAAEDILVEEFYTADNSLCKLVEEHWESMQ